MKHTKQRTNEDAKRELAAIIRDMKDPRIPVMTTVTAVNLTPDLKYAKVFVSILAAPDEITAAMKSLKSAAGFVRRELGVRLNLRNTPEITFERDTSIERGAHIAEIINRIEGGRNDT